MATLPNPFLNSAMPTAESAVAFSDPSGSDATAALNSALASAMTADTDAAPDLTDPPVAAAVLIQSSCDGTEVRRAETGNMPGSVPGEDMSSTAASFERKTWRGAAIQPCAGVTPSSQEAIPSNEGRPEEAPAPRCTEQHEGAGALESKLDWQSMHDLITDDRFVLFELTDEVPLFIRSGDHLRRWEA